MWPFGITESNKENYADDTTLYKCETNLTEAETERSRKIWILNIDSANYGSEIELWKPISCPCRLCKVSLSQIGFIW